MPMITCTATFSDGTTKTRKSIRPYGAAWRVVIVKTLVDPALHAKRGYYRVNDPDFCKVGDTVTFDEIGFSARLELADVAARGCATQYRRAKEPGVDVTTTYETVTL